MDLIVQLVLYIICLFLLILIYIKFFTKDKESVTEQSVLNSLNKSRV